ncbi:MAG: hypothetical protein ACYTFW_06630 [Planctomycetota bacterium]
MLLRQLTKIAPPGEGQRHNLTVEDNGDLVLYLMLGDIYHPVKFEDEDLDKPITQLLAEIELELIKGLII